MVGSYQGATAQSRRSPSGVADTEPSDDVGPSAKSDQLTSLAAAEEAVSAAESRAEEARARAAQLRQLAEARPGEQSETIEDAEDAEAEDSEAATAEGDVPAAEIEPEPARSRRWRAPRVRRPEGAEVVIGVGILVACAALAAGGYMVWQDRAIMHKRQLAPEFAAAAREGITALMSIDPRHAREDIQRIIDASTGDLKLQIEARSAMMARQAEESKVVSRVTVEAVGVEPVSDNSGVALVAAKSDVTDPDNSKRPAMMWRISVKIDRDGDQLKMSGVDFLQ
jgi:Mce-associated membrane protein